MKHFAAISIAILAIASSISADSAMDVVECNKACHKIYEPVCATFRNGRTMTFSNECTLEVYLCKHPHEKVRSVVPGKCTEPGCEKTCFDIYDPVCATFEDGTSKTYSNQCELDNALCGHPQEKVVVTKGECAHVDPYP